MGYPLSIVRLKKGLVNALPLDVSGDGPSPLAGPFDGFTRARLSYTVGKFPFAQKLPTNVRDTYEIEAPGGGRLEVWLTPDGHIFMDSQAGLELVLSLYIELRNVCPDIAIEDPQRGVMHNAISFKEFLCGEDTAEKPLKAFVDETAA
ncbi:MAG: hypothetical protein JNK82_44070 [Myxococcaceae bacterium]|nr:hypothetical protein [Myxococcaceae bacterium]